MTTPPPDPRPVTEADLHGWVDDQLSTERRQTVEQWLSTRPQDAATVRQWREDRDRLRAGFSDATTPALPLHLLPRARRRPVTQMRLAASVVLALGAGLGVGGFAGWHAHRPPIGVAAIAQESLAADRIFTQVADLPPQDSAAPQDAVSGDAAHIGIWASRILGRAVTPPDLRNAGYRLEGGHMMATLYGPGCVFVYAASSGDALLVFMRPMHSVDVNAHMRALPHSRQQGTARGYVWADDGLGVGLVGHNGQDVLRLARDVRDGVLRTASPAE